MSLVPFSARRVPTLWLDTATGLGVAPHGGRVSAGVRYTYTRAGAGVGLSDVLDAAALVSAERVQLVGANPGPAWLLEQLPAGWEHGRHHLDHETFVGRYTAANGQRVEVRRAAEWFGAGNYSPKVAASAWDALAAVLAAVVPGAGLLGSPGATGREAWLWSCPVAEGGRVVPEQVDPELAELIRATGGQHRIELFRAPVEDDDYAPATMQGLWVMDGRLMYAACLRQLGTGGALMSARTAGQLLETDPYARARYHVRVTVPAGWDRVGILGLAGEDGAGWTYPRTPGETFETWADSAEVTLALRNGWQLETLGGIVHDTGRPLDTWAERLLRGYAHAAGERKLRNVDVLEPELARLVRAAFRAMLLYSVGAWHSTGATESTVTAGPMDRPAGDGWEPPERTAHGAVWRRRVPLSGRAALMAHPELSAQVWGRARARVLWAPTADARQRAGALTVPLEQLVSIYGDAVMTTSAPAWAGDQYDDGKPGRLRVKGHLCGPLPWPATTADRDRLMHAAEAAASQPCTCS